MYSSLMFNKIYRKIKKYNTIVIARHVGADPDALASQIALRESIKKTFPKKNVYAIGYTASKFKYLGNFFSSFGLDINIIGLSFIISFFTKYL